MHIYKMTCVLRWDETIPSSKAEIKSMELQIICSYINIYVCIIEWKERNPERQRRTSSLKGNHNCRKNFIVAQ